MATTPRSSTKRPVEYPTSDGKPMAETDVHRNDMGYLIAALGDHFAADPMVYVTGNLLLYYEEGDKHKRVAPDVMVVRGVPKLPPRRYYLLWEEGRGPAVVIELTSKKTRREDRDQKLVLYRDLLRVPEYFLFDPFEEYLKPSLQGYRLVDGQYVAIEPEADRLPSGVLGLHLVRRDVELRLYNPATGRCLPTPEERVAEEAAARLRAEEAWQRAEEAWQRAEEAWRHAAEDRQRAAEDRQRAAEDQQRAAEDRQRETEARQRAAEDRQREAEALQQVQAENERLRRELAALKRKVSGEA